MTDGDEFSSWFTHDGGPCPLTSGTVVIRESQKTRPGAKVAISNSNTTLLSDNFETFTTLVTIPNSMEGPNSWEWKYFGQLCPTGLKMPKVIRYRVKKSPGVKLLEQLAKDPPIDLIPDPERKLLEYHPS